MNFLFFGTSLALLEAELCPVKDWEEKLLILGGLEGPHHLKSDQIFKKKWAPHSTTIIIHFRKNNALWGIQKKLCPSVTTLAE